MKPSQLAIFLTAAFAIRKPVLVEGEPGTGKSAVVAQATAASGRRLVISHPAVEDPTDAKGIPWGSPDGGISMYPLGQIREVLEATEPTVWALEDFGQAGPAMQAAYMQWILARECAGHRLPDCVTIVALTNGRKHRAGVSGLLEPVKSRFLTIVSLQPDVEDFSRHALANGFQPIVVALLRFRPELLCRFEPTAELVNSPSPRTWEHASDLLGMPLPEPILAESLAGAVGAGAAAELLGFRRMFLELPSVDAILLDPDTAKLPESPGALYAISTALAARAKPGNFDRMARYCDRMLKAGNGEFVALLVRDAHRTEPGIAATAGFLKLATGPLGDLLSGEE